MSETRDRPNHNGREELGTTVKRLYVTMRKPCEGPAVDTFQTKAGIVPADQF